MHIEEGVIRTEAKGQGGPQRPPWEQKKVNWFFELV